MMTHGRMICSSCLNTIRSCGCFECIKVSSVGNISYSVCDTCIPSSSKESNTPRYEVIASPCPKCDGKRALSYCDGNGCGWSYSSAYHPWHKQNDGELFHVWCTVCQFQELKHIINKQ